MKRSLYIDYATMPLVGRKRNGKMFGLPHDMRRIQHSQRRCGEMADATDLKSVGL